MTSENMRDEHHARSAEIDAFEQARAGVMAALVAVSNFVRVDRVLGSQVPAGRQTFFGHADPVEPSAARTSRFLEWFTLERKAEGSGGAPIQAFVSAGCPGLEAELHLFAHALAASRSGIWAIRDREGDFLELDAADGSEESARLWMPALQSRATAGQTVLGRLLNLPHPLRPEEERILLATDATALFAGTAIYEAYAEELERRQLAATDDAARRTITQLELEQILAAHEEAAGESPEAVEDELRDFLDRAGADASKIASVDELSYALSVATSPGHVLGPFLEELAFETSIDIERAQRLSLRLWNAHHARRVQEERARDQDATSSDGAGDAGSDTERATSRVGEPSSVEGSSAAPKDVPAPTPPSQLGAMLVEELEKGLAEGQEVEALFGRLEAMIDEGAPGSGDLATDKSSEIPEEIRWHTEDEGDFEALVEEYLWERGRTEHPPSAEHSAELRAIREVAAGFGVHSVDELRETHLASMLVEAWTRGEEEHCIARLDALSTWHEWLLASQEIELHFDPNALRDTLREARARCAELAAQIRDEAQDASDAPLAWRVTKTRDGAWVCRHEARELRFDASCRFEVGDLVLGSVPRAGTRFDAAARVLPPLLAATLSKS